RVVTDSDPSGSPSKTWATEVVRNEAGQVIEIHSPASIDTYTDSTGSFTDAGSGAVGLVTFYERVSSGDAVGFLRAIRHQEGTADPAPLGDELYYDQWFDY